MKTLTKEDQEQLTPKKALDLLVEGNSRFQANLKIQRDLLEQVNSTAEGQFPFAVILSCIDSRTSAELIFDQGLGDIFSIRIAGNVLNNDILGSMEFACQLAGSKLIVVMGHSECGAVKGACDEKELGHLTNLLQKIHPAVELVKSSATPSKSDFHLQVAEENVDLIVDQIAKESKVIKDLILKGQIGIVGMMYSVHSGAIQLREKRMVDTPHG